MDPASAAMFAGIGLALLRVGERIIAEARTHISDEEWEAIKARKDDATEEAARAAGL